MYLALYNKVVYNCWTGLVDWTGGLDSWTRELDASNAAITLVIASMLGLFMHEIL